MKVTLAVTGCVGYKQIFADLFAVDEQLEETETADNNRCLFASYGIETLSEKWSITARAFNPFGIFKNLFVCQGLYLHFAQLGES